MIVSRLLILAAIAAAFASETHAAPPLEVKGVALGAPKSVLRERFPHIECTGQSCTFRPLVNCSAFKEPAQAVACLKEQQERYSFGTAVPMSYKVNLASDDRVAAITITLSHAAFEGIVAALVEKYGRPTSDVQGQSQNRFGAKFSDRTIQWTRKDGAISANERIDDIDTSMVTFASTEFLNQMRDRATERPKAAAKNL